MPNVLTRRRKVGLTLFLGGLALTLACQLAGNWELFRYGGTWRSLYSRTLGYDIAVYDAQPDKPEVGRVVIYPGFAASTQVYFPLALSLLRSGYAVRLLSHSGTPDSPAEMSYKAHLVESSEAARDFVSDGNDVPLFLIGHSEGTRYAIQTGREMPSVKGIVAMSPVSASLDTQRPANVLALVASDDFDPVKHQSYLLLISGTQLARPELNKLYGDLQQGTARMVETLPKTNHFNVFINRDAQRETVNWLNRITGNADAKVHVSNPLKFPMLALGALLGAAVAVIGIGLLFSQTTAKSESTGIPSWAFLVVIIGGWALAAVVSNYVTLAQKIPLLVYGRLLVLFVLASIPLAIVAAVRPKLCAGIPRGSWKARLALVALTATMLLFDRWLIGVMPTGRRLMWFALAALISGIYFGLDEFLRRGIQRATDWRAGLALGVTGGFIAALSVAAAGFFLWSPLGQFVVGGAATLFGLMVGCEFFATYLYATSGDWFLSWWVRVSVFNGFLAALVPLISENAFRAISR